MTGRWRTGALTALVTLAVAPAAAHAAPEYRLVGQLPTTGASGVPGMAVDPTTHTLHVIDGGSRIARYVNGVPGEPYELRGPDGRYDSAFGIDVDPSDHSVGLASFAAGFGFQADASAALRFVDGARAGTTDVANRAHAIAIDPSTHTSYVLSAAGLGMNARDELAEIRGDAVVRTTQLAFATSVFATGGVSAGDIAVDSRTHTVYVTDADAGAVAVIEDGAVTGSIDVGADPGELAVDPTTGTLYVTHESRDEVSVVRRGALIATAEVGDRPVDVAVDSTTGTAFVLNAGDETVSVLRDDTVSRTTTAGVADPRTLAVDSGDGTLYVAGYALGGPVGSAAQAISVLKPVDAPGVVLTGPDGDFASTRTDAFFYAIFDRKMDEAASRGAFTVVRGSPFTGEEGQVTPVAGKVSWLWGVVAIFVPDEPLTPGYPYTATIGTVAEDTDGKALAGPVSWSVYAKAPAVEDHSPEDGATGVSPTAPLWVGFDEPIPATSRDAFAAAFTLKPTAGGATVPGHFGWYADRVLVFQPDAPLPAGGYVATQGTPPPDIFGTVSSWSFTVGGGR